jgi:hypothetical protein
LDGAGEGSAKASLGSYIVRIGKTGQVLVCTRSHLGVPKVQ